MEGLGKERVLVANRENGARAFAPDCGRCLGLLTKTRSEWCKMGCDTGTVDGPRRVLAARFVLVPSGDATHETSLAGVGTLRFFAA